MCAHVHVRGSRKVTGLYRVCCDALSTNVNVDLLKFFPGDHTIVVTATVLNSKVTCLPSFDSLKSERNGPAFAGPLQALLGEC